MNHLKIYESIIQNAKSENRIKKDKNDPGYIYYEKHHILPRCLGGSNKRENLVLLTAREHYVCHKLLTYIYKGDSRLAYALIRIVYDKRERKLCSKDYAFAKELYTSIPMSIEQRKNISLSLIGKSKSKTAKENMSKCKIGEGNGMYKKHHLEKTKEKMSKSHKGIPSPLKGISKSDEFKKKQSITHKGEKNAMYGKSFYDIWLIKYGKEIADQKLLEFKEKQRKKIPWNKGLKKIL